MLLIYLTHASLTFLIVKCGVRVRNDRRKIIKISFKKTDIIN